MAELGNKPLGFYHIPRHHEKYENKDNYVPYTDYLREIEHENYRTPRVNHNCYEDLKSVRTGERASAKFFFGPFVFEKTRTVKGQIVKPREYYIPVSCQEQKIYSKINKDNTLEIIDFENNKKIGTLKFNFMIPAPSEMVRYYDINNLPDGKTEEENKKLYRLIDQLTFCADKEQLKIIASRAQSTFNDKILLDLYDKESLKACPFRLLEEACDSYERYFINPQLNPSAKPPPKDAADYVKRFETITSIYDSNKMPPYFTPDDRYDYFYD